MISSSCTFLQAAQEDGDVGLVSHSLDLSAPRNIEAATSAGADFASDHAWKLHSGVGSSARNCFGNDSWKCFTAAQTGHPLLTASLVIGYLSESPSVFMRWSSQ